MSLYNLFGPFRGPRDRKSRPADRRIRPQLEVLESRLTPYNVSGNAWVHPEVITLSFVPDGTNLGGASSNLFATFNARWSTATWQGEIIRAAQVWAQQTGINFDVVTDSGANLGGTSYQQGDPTVGDIRIGGFNFGTGNSNLATAYQPPPENNYSIAGDIQFNTGKTFNINSSTNDLFTIAAHEIGHALGFLHSGTTTAVMYGAYNGKKSALTTDDINGIHAIYGTRPADAYDAAGSNGTFATATDVSTQVDPVGLTGLVTGLDVTTTSDVDFYTVVAPDATTGTFKVIVQSDGLSLLRPKVTVYASNQTTVLGSATATGLLDGSSQAVTVTGVSAGQRFYIKVVGADTTAFGTGAYALALNFGTNPDPVAPPPNTQVPNGDPLHGGGGQPLQDNYPVHHGHRLHRLDLGHGAAGQPIHLVVHSGHRSRHDHAGSGTLDG